MKIAVDEVANEGLEEGRGYEEDHASPMGIHNVGDEAVDLNISRDSSEDTVTADFVRPSTATMMLTIGSYSSLFRL